MQQSYDLLDKRTIWCRKICISKKLHKLNPNSFIFDAEEVGNAIRDNMPKELFNGYIFEGYDLWFETIVALLKEITKKYNGDIYIPMTLVYKDSFDKIRKPLAKENIKIKHILLESTYDVIKDRILARGEDEDSWCMQNINLCLENQREFTEVIRIKTIGDNICKLADQVIKIK